MTQYKIQKFVTSLAVVMLVSACATRPVVETEAANNGSIGSDASQAGTTNAQQEAQDASGPVTSTPTLESPAVPGGMNGMDAGNQTTFQSNPFSTALEAQSALLANARERVFFELDSAALSGNAREVLSSQAEFLRTYPSIQVIVEGNADERGTREYNLALGSRRAASVKDYLVALGVEPSRILTVSFGKERPIDGRSNEAGWAMNRNARTLVIEIE